MKIRKIFVSEDGEEFNSLSECLAHDGKFLCPLCMGVGKIQQKYNAYPSGLPDSGFVDDWKYRNVHCNLCDGLGYTEKQLKPVTKIVGYK